MAATLEQRLNKLEASNRRMRRLLAAIGVALGLGVFLGQAAPDDDLTVDAPPKVIEAEQDDGAPREIVTSRLRIVDAEGKDRIECTVLGDMPVMKFYDRDGVARISMLSRPESSSLEIADKAGAMRASLGNNPSGPGMMFRGLDQKPSLILSAGRDGPGLILFDADRPRILVGVRDDEPLMSILNRGTNLSFGNKRPEPDTPPIELELVP